MGTGGIRAEKEKNERGGCVYVREITGNKIMHKVDGWASQSSSGKSHLCGPAAWGDVVGCGVEWRGERAYVLDISMWSDAPMK